MIPRYARSEMTEIWSDLNKYKIWLDIELASAEACANIGMIPQAAASVLREKSKNLTFNPERINEIESETKHDVIAFLTHVSEMMDCEETRFLHQGMTSSDVLDTAFSVQLTQATDLLLADLKKTLTAIEKRAREHKHTVMIGRSHGIHAEPITFGFKLAGHYAEFKRCETRLKAAREEIAICAISGAVGTFANIPPSVQDFVSKKLGLRSETHSTQIIPRDRHAVFFCTLGIIGSAIERLATEIRHLQRTEVLEAEEYFSEKQKGSSAMPHKRNPVLTENLTGLARLVRSAVTPALENITLWHERDISHSAVERGIGPDTTIHLNFALNRLTNVIENLIVYPENMQKNLNRLGGLHHSQQVLLALTQKGLSREAAYGIVQKSAMKIWREGGDFLTELQKDSEITARLSESELKELFDTRAALKHLDEIFKRCFED